MNSGRSTQRWLARYVFLTTLATFCLVWVGGLVTSHGAGMAVPDWPNTFGYNMFFFPISKWMGGIFYEHTHRLLASAVGVLTTIMALWLNGYKSRPVLRWGGLGLLVCVLVFPRLFPDSWGYLVVGTGAVAVLAGFFWPTCEPYPLWMRALGWTAFGLVVVQGVLGGLRVTQINSQLGIFHATLAQLFFLLLASIGLFLTRSWAKLPVRSERDFGNLRGWLVAGTILVVAQLALGATMRHQHAGLAIPDFPAAYGKLWPPTDAQSLEIYNQNRMELEGCEPITAFHIWLQMAHRIGALIVLLVVAFVVRHTIRQYGRRHLLAKWAAGWGAVTFVQACLGAATLWTGKSADIATLHVAFGALTLLVGGLLTIISYRVLAPVGTQVLNEKPGAGSSKPAAGNTAPFPGL